MSGASSDSGSEFDDQDHDFGDWCSDASNPSAPTVALFAEADGNIRSFSSPYDALQHAKASGCDLVSLVSRLQLDTLQVIRLINHARRHKVDAQQLNAISGNEEWLNSEDELKPVAGFEDDGLLQLDFDLLSADATEQQSTSTAADSSSSEVRIKQLEQQLATARTAFDELRSIHASSLGLATSDLAESSSTPLSMEQRGRLASSTIRARTTRPEDSKEDDSLYFDSYSTNSIHQTMISDSARTLSYAKFLLHPANAHLIRGKVVMDVGCGTGILSLFAARAGAKQVIAIDASEIVTRARQNVENNNFGHIVKVYRGKLEHLDGQLAVYKGKVDILVSEWMGYFLLYEGMLPSVLHARDLYLRAETGILAPNNMTMHLAAFCSPELLQTKIGYWDDVHGFNMSSMTEGLLNEAFVDTLDTDDVITSSFVFANLDLQRVPAKQPEPTSDFELTVESDKDTVHGFISWFDTFFFPSSRIPSQAPECPAFTDTEKDIAGMDLKGNSIVASNSASEDGHLVSFSTSPYSKETHWQQTLFVLKEPITGVKKGDKIKGQIVVQQNKKWMRELDVELHYLHVSSSSMMDATKKKVEAKLVQTFKVR